MMSSLCEQLAFIQYWRVAIPSACATTRVRPKESSNSCTSGSTAVQLKVAVAVATYFPLPRQTIIVCTLFELPLRGLLQPSAQNDRLSATVFARSTSGVVGAIRRTTHVLLIFFITIIIIMHPQLQANFVLVFVVACYTSKLKFSTLICCRHIDRASCTARQVGVTLHGFLPPRYSEHNDLECCIELHFISRSLQFS